MISSDSLGLNDIQPEDPNAKVTPDPKTSEAQSDYEREEQQYVKELQTLHLKTLSVELRQREKFAKWVFVLIVGWLFLVLIMTCVSGVRNSFLILPKEVLITLIGSTTINIIGLLYIVMRYVFRAEASAIRPIEQHAQD